RFVIKSPPDLRYKGVTQRCCQKLLPVATKKSRFATVADYLRYLFLKQFCMQPAFLAHPVSRRKFICSLTNHLGAATLTMNGLSTIAGCGTSQEQKDEDQVTRQKKQHKLGVALVGLGGYSWGELAPALQETKHCYLAGIVTGTPRKVKDWKDKYSIPGR